MSDWRCHKSAVRRPVYYYSLVTGDITRLCPYLLTDYFNSILLLKPAAQAQVGKTKLSINCFRNSTSTCDTENWRKHNLRKQPTVDCSLEPIQRSGVEHSVGRVIPHSNPGWQKTPCQLGRSTPWYFKLYDELLLAAARVCRFWNKQMKTRWADDSSSN